MTPEDRIYFNSLEETFGTTGWKILVEEATKKIYQLQADSLEAKTWEEVLVARGRALQLQDLIDAQEVATMALKSLEDEDASV